MDSETGISLLRDKYRPRRVTTLFVGESSPAQGTHFYRANSNLFRAVQAAFVEAFGGDETVGSGEAFLRIFKSKGCWLVDLADRPVNRMDAPERRAAVASGIPALAETIADVRPRHMVVIKSDIAPSVARAIELAAPKRAPDVLVLRYPLRQWRTEFITKLAAFLAEHEAKAAA